jgi:hypothetical protein
MHHAAAVQWRCGGTAEWRMGAGNPEEKEDTRVCESVGPFGMCRSPPTTASDGFKLDRTPYTEHFR